LRTRKIGEIGATLNFVHIRAEETRIDVLVSDFSGGIDELVYSIYLSSELIVIGTQTVDGPGVL
jgi:hypothetical protein